MVNVLNYVNYDLTRYVSKILEGENEYTYICVLIVSNTYEFIKKITLS